MTTILKSIMSKMCFKRQRFCVKIENLNTYLIFLNLLINVIYLESWRTKESTVSWLLKDNKSRD